MSAMKSIKFGFGLNLTNNQIDKVNTYCRGRVYLDDEASIFLNGSKEKKDF